MDGEADLIGPRRRRLQIALLVLAVAIAAGVALLFWQRSHARARVEARLRAIAGELDRCLVGADGISYDAIYDDMVVRAIDHRPPAVEECNAAAAAKVRELDDDGLPDKVEDLYRELDYTATAGMSAPSDACVRVESVRNTVAALDGVTRKPLRCLLRESNARELDYVRDATAEERHGELYDVVISDGAEQTLRRYKPDGGIAAELAIGYLYAVDGDDVVFVTPTLFSRWRAGKRLDGPSLSDAFGQVRAWRRTSAGDVGVFYTKDGFRVQTFDDKLAPIGKPRFVAATHDAHVGIGPAGEVVALEGRFACTTDRTIWNATDLRVQSAPIGQPLAGDATLEPGDHAAAIDCDDAHLYIVTADAYEICDRARCTVARKLRHLKQAAVRAHDGGAEALVVVDADDQPVLLDLRDPRGDGHVTITPYSDPYADRPLSFGGRWYVMREP